jgi:molybdopterin/thiamine biosynthesis adenylyltransferase/pimeloyl-ACP methyl ester carboxylesterase/rhodanese-related sulfurtransferase
MVSLAGGEEVWVAESGRTVPGKDLGDVLCIHGVGGSATNWTDFMGELAPEFASVAVDLPGSGFSPPPRTMAGYSLKALAATVAKVIEDHMTAPVHVVGNSMGGAVSVKLAVARPDLVKTLTLISPALPDRGLQPSHLQFPLLALPKLGTVIMRRTGLISAEQRVAGVANTCFFDPSVIHKDRLAQEVAELRRRDQLDYADAALIGAARALTAEYLRPRGGSLWRDAEQVRVPVLAVYGSHDKLVHPRGAAQAARSFRDAPDARVLVLPRTGHVAQMEHPALVAGFFREMVDRTQGMPHPATGLSLLLPDLRDSGVSTVSLPPLVEPAADLSVDEVKRYSRHLIIPDVGMAGQKRLKNAKVLVVGAGGLGSPALLYLAAAGVGTLGIVDFDTVDESNLQRQIIHGVSDVGKPKAESAKESIAEINPYVKVILHEERLDSSNVMEIFADYDLIVDGTDNFATRYLVNDACVLLHKPYVWGSIYRFDGQASVFWADYGPCYRCLYPEPPPPGMVPSCAEGGVLGVLCASIGSIQVNEAIKLIDGIGEPILGRLMIYDALEMTYRSVKVNKDPDCAICGKNPTVTELIDYEAFCGAVSDEAAEAVIGSTISAKDLAAMMERGEDFYLVDVREPNEYEIVSIPGATLIPKGEFLSGAALSDLPQDKQIVLHCKSGARSAEVLAVLKDAGFKDAVHVGGGVLAWVNQVDPSLPTY